MPRKYIHTHYSAYMIKTQTYDVAIQGGGMVGMSLAIALAKQGMSILVLERGNMPAQLAPTFDGRVSAIALGSKHILHEMGAWDGMAAQAEPICDIRVSDGNAPFFLHYDHQEIGDNPFGYIVENRYIRHGLHQAAHALPTLTIRENTMVSALEQHGGFVTLTLSDHSTVQCRLLIGADGKQSSIRTMAGIDATQWGYDQTAIVCTIEHSKPHHGLAQERFLPAGPFAVLPMTNNRSSLVWVEPDDRVSLYMELPEDEFVQEIMERTGSYLGDIRCPGNRFTYPLSLMHAKSYIAERIALIGDAAHGIHPLAGQGVNLGFRDVGVLSELLGERFRLGLDIGSADILAHYQQWRRFDNVTMLAVTDNLNRLFGYNALPLRIIRGLGLWGVSQIPPLKRFFMRHAMGLVGDLPESVRKNT
jgi:2-octaprenyl-6-methoxyphenol hydroxylase